MKEEALKLADEIDNFLKEEEQLPWGTKQVYLDMASTMIRRLVEELDKQGEPYVWHMKSNDPDLVKDYWYFIEKPSRESKISHQAIPLYTAPQTKPTITKLDGKVVAVTMTDDEHRVHEVLWEAPKPLSDEEIDKLADEYLSDYFNMQVTINFARAIEERHGIK